MSENDTIISQHLNAIEALVAKHGYSRGGEFGDDPDIAHALVDLVTQLQKLDDEYISKDAQVIVLVEGQGDSKSGYEEYVYLEVRLKMSDGVVVVSPDQIDPTEYAGCEFPAIVSNLITDVTDRAATIAEDFYGVWTRLANHE